MNIADIINAVQANKVRITDHADEEADAGEIIEDYPTDKPYPSCLIYGQTFGEEPVHSVWAYNEQNLWAVLITVYRPDPDRWINWRERRRKQ
ncbi:MAG: DUF4258 domain-containing protein [Deltaproteobacteria bacterium]|nr:DUF4258 domain-containing protein [Deltaproteobacteria bacterium]